MKKEESFEQRDKLHSFVREHKPIPSSFAGSTCSSKKRKNVILDVQRRKSVCVIETNSNRNNSVELKAKQSSRKRHRATSTDTGINYSKSESNDGDSDYVPNNLELKRRKLITKTKNKLLEKSFSSNNKFDTNSTELKNNDELDEEKQEALNKAFFWRFRKLLDKGYFNKEMIRHRRKPSTIKRIHQSAVSEQYSDSSDIEISIKNNPKQLNNNKQFENISSDENIPEKYSNNTLLKSNTNTKTCLIKNNQKIPFESVSALNLNTNIFNSDNSNSNINRINIDETKCVCNTKPCTLKARLLASTTNNANKSNQNVIETNCTITEPAVVINNSRTVSIKKPETMENNPNTQRVSALESDVILCLANLKNFVNSEAAQLNDTISKIPLRSIVEPTVRHTPQILNNTNPNHNIEPQINPPYNINIVNSNVQNSPPTSTSTQNILFQKYMQNKKELTKNIRLFLEQNRRQFHQLVQQRNLCISELHHAERARDYFKVEWIKTRLQYLNHLIEKIKADCKYDSSEINKFTLHDQSIPSTYLTETGTAGRNIHQEMPPQVFDRMAQIQKELHLRQEQLKFFSNDALVEGNRVLKYPFGGIITNTSEQNTKQQTPRDKLIMQNSKVMPPLPPDHSTKLTPIPQYLMQNHTIVRSEKESTSAAQKHTNNNNNNNNKNNSDKILFKPYESTFNQKSQQHKLTNKTNLHQPHLQHPENPVISSYNQQNFNTSNLTRMNSVIQRSQKKQHQFTIDQIMSKQHRNLNHPTYTNHNIDNIFAQPYINPVKTSLQQNVNILQTNHLDKQKNTFTSIINSDQNSQVKQTNIASESAKKQKGRSSIIYCAPKANTEKTAANIPKYSCIRENNLITVDDKIPNRINEISQQIIPDAEENVAQLTKQELRPKPALIPISVIRKLTNKLVSIPKKCNSSTDFNDQNKQNKSATVVNEERPNKRIKLDANSSVSPETKISTDEKKEDTITKTKINSNEEGNITNNNTPKIINENEDTVTEINSETNTITNESSGNTNTADSSKEKDENKENNKRKRHLRLQFSLISNKTITLSYLLKMMNQNLSSNSLSNFILKPKNIEELCSIIRNREIFSKIEENSPCQYPNVLTIMNHFLIYVIVCIQIENKINFKEVYLKLIRDKGPTRYDYYHEPDPISLENIDMYLQKAALELHEAIIFNSAENNTKNNDKCICSKIKTFNEYKPQNDTEEYDNNYFIKAHGETEISIIVLYEPKFKNATNMTKQFKKKCQNDVSPANTYTFDEKQNNSSQNVENVQVISNFSAFTNINSDLMKNSYKTDLVPLRTLAHENQLNQPDKNMAINFDISQLAKSFENWEKLLENPENQRIVSEIFENHFIDENKLENRQISKDTNDDDADVEIKNATFKSTQTKNNGSKWENSSSPDFDKTFDNIWNDMENSNELIAMSEEELEKEIVDLLDKDANVNNEIIRKRRISLTETCLEPSFKNIRIQAEEMLNSDKTKISKRDESKFLTNKQNNGNVEKIDNLKEVTHEDNSTNETDFNTNNINSNDTTEINSQLNTKSDEIINNKSPDFAKINKYKVINVEEKCNLSPSMHETIRNYWKNFDDKNNDSLIINRTLKNRDEKNTSKILVDSITDKTTKQNNMKTQNQEIITENKIIDEIKKNKKENNNDKVPEKIIEICRIKENPFDVNKKYYDDPKLKISVNKNNDFLQKTPLDLSISVKNNKETKNNEEIKNKTDKLTLANKKQSKTENKNQSTNKNCKRSKLENNFLDDTFLGTKNNFLDSKCVNNAFLGQTNKKHMKNVINATKCCINFNTLVYINEIDYKIILEILNKAAKPLYTFYKFVNTTRCNNNQPLINFTAFFFGLKFKKLQKYKKMYEELYKK